MSDDDMRVRCEDLSEQLGGSSREKIEMLLELAVRTDRRRDEAVLEVQRLREALELALGYIDPFNCADEDYKKMRSALEGK